MAIIPIDQLDSKSSISSSSGNNIIPIDKMENSQPSSHVPSSKINMTGEGFGDEIGELGKLANTSVKKTFGGNNGTSFTEDATAKSLAGDDIPAATSRPFDANLGDVQDTAFKNNVMAMGKDSLTSPSVALGIGSKSVGLALKDAAGSLGEGINTIKNNISRMALNPEFRSTSSTLKYGQDAKRVMQNMPDIVGTDVHSTLAAVNNKLEETGKAIGDTIANHPNANVKLNAAPSVLKPFSDKISELNKIDPKGNAALIKRLQDAQQSLIKITDEDGKVIGTHNLQNMTPKELFEYRQQKIDPRTRYTGNPSDDKDLNEVFQKVKSNVKDLQNKNMPELKPLNQDYGDLHVAGDAMQKLVNKVDNEGLPSINWKDVTTVGIHKWLANPINRINMSRWLYTAPKAQIQAAAQSVPNFTSGVKQSYGGFKNAELVTTPKGVSGPKPMAGITKTTPTGLNEPMGTTTRTGINTNISTGALPNPGNTAIKQPGFVPKGLPEAFQGRSGIDRPWENKGLPTPNQTGRSSIPMGGKILDKDALAKNANPTGGPNTFSGQLYTKMKTPQGINLHPAEDVRMGIKNLNEQIANHPDSNIAKNMGIAPTQVEHLRDIKGLLESSKKGTNQGFSTSGGMQGERSHWYTKSNMPESLKGKYTQNELSSMLENKLNGGKVTPGQSLVIKKLLKHFFPSS